MGPGRVYGGTRYSTLPAHPSCTTPGTPPLHAVTGLHAARGQYPRLKVAVGLISVARLTLSAEISRLRGMTEGYNLVRIDKR